jgi:hypothetical protein
MSGDDSFMIIFVPSFLFIASIYLFSYDSICFPLHAVCVVLCCVVLCSHSAVHRFGREGDYIFLITQQSEYFIALPKTFDISRIELTIGRIAMTVCAIERAIGGLCVFVFLDFC